MKKEEKNVDEFGVEEYDVKVDAWEVYKKMYKENLEFEIIRGDNRPYIKSQFKYGDKISRNMKFSGEVDFNFSNKKIRELNRSRYLHYKKILERDLKEESMRTTFIKLLEECRSMHHSPENISIMLKYGNMQGAKRGIGIDRLDVWLLVLNMKYEDNINLLQNHCTIENASAIDEFLNMFEDVYDYAKTIYHIDRKLVNDLIESGKNPLDSAYNIINFMLLAKRFWEQKKKNLDN